MPDPAWLPVSVPLIGAAVIYGLLGLAHAVYTLHDVLRRPRYFRPGNHELVADLQATTVALAPGGRDYWTASLGFHLSHSIGVLLLALLILVSHSAGLAWLLPLLILVSATFALIAWRFWFRIPLVGCVLATALLIAAWAF